MDGRWCCKYCDDMIAIGEHCTCLTATKNQLTKYINLYKTEKHLREKADKARTIILTHVIGSKKDEWHLMRLDNYYSGFMMTFDKESWQKFAFEQGLIAHFKEDEEH